MSGEDIKKRRKELGWKQSDLAEKMGVSVNTVSTWENGGVVPGTTEIRLKEVLYRADKNPSDKEAKVNSLKAEIYQATSDLIDVLDAQIAEAQKDTSTIKSIEELQQLLRVKFELIEQLKQSIE